MLAVGYCQILKMRFVFGVRDKKKSCLCRTFIGALGRTRTCDLLIRSQTLYPAELRAREIRDSYDNVRRVDAQGVGEGILSFWVALE